MKAIAGVLSVMLTMALTVPAISQVAIKTNLVKDAMLTPNLGVEVGVAPKWSVELSAGYNGWTLSNQRRWKQMFLQPEVKYWFCDRFSGHFVDLHLLGGAYNFGAWKHGSTFLGTHFEDLKTQRHQGWFAGAGIGYGYTWILAKHWSLEAELGIGWAYTRYDVYPCKNCGTKIAEKRVHNYVGPTKAAINLIYVF